MRRHFRVCSSLFLLTQGLYFNIMSSFAEFERDMIVERTQEGIKDAKEKGVMFGRKSKHTKLKVLYYMLSIK